MSFDWLAISFNINCLENKKNLVSISKFVLTRQQAHLHIHTIQQYLQVVNYYDDTFEVELNMTKSQS